MSRLLSGLLKYFFAFSPSASSHCIICGKRELRAKMQRTAHYDYVCDGQSCQEAHKDAWYGLML
jgi:hypothetical protein